MKTRLLLISAILLISACTDSSSTAGDENNAAATNSPLSTSGVSGPVEGDELPLIDADGAGHDPDTPTGDNADAPVGEDPSPEPIQTDGGAGGSEGEETAEVAEVDPEVAASIDAFTACAIVEAGYIAALDGEPNVVELYGRGAQTAIDSNASRYVPLGEALLAAAGQSDANTKADMLLDQCASDGFERLAG
ncbi:MAG: hypothetical protein R2706_16240 [Acidimicrobiales bacterium]